MTSVATCRAPTCCATGRGPRRAGAGSAARGSARGRSAKQKPKKKKGGGGFFSWLSKKEHRGRGRRGDGRAKIEPDRAGVAAVTPIKKKKKKAPMTYGD